MGNVPNNIFGLLGGGIGVLTALNHIATSIYRNIVNGSHLLGQHGVFGERDGVEDQRNHPVRIVFGVFSLPFVLPVILVTNLFDATFTFIQHVFISFGRNLRVSFNLLGENGIFGERLALNDDRHLAVKIIFGIISAPLVAVPALITNLFDASIIFIKHFALSFARNLNVVYNLLGERGIFGARNQFEDDRSLPTKIAFGILSAPLVLLPAIITNLFDLSISLIKNVALSYARNVRMTYNLLGDRGILGPRREFDDDRPMLTKILYGILSAPLVLVHSVITNIIDVTFSIIKHVALSFSRNLRVIFNLLGNNGVMGDRNAYADERNLETRIVYGILSAPLIIIPAVITNLIDITATFIKNMSLSFARNLRSIFNLIGADGIMGPRIPYADDRGLPARIIFGIISAPLVLIPCIVTNVIDITCAFIKNVAFSFIRNLRASFNLLGERGVMGPRFELQDDRGLPARIIFGIISAPLVLIPGVVTNVIDITCAFIKNVAFSFIRNLRASFNLLGERGVMGPRFELQDDRGLPAKICYGILTTPFVALPIIITNLVDGICSLVKHVSLSFARNLSSIFNLLGDHGVMGVRRPLEDDRGMAAKVVFGILSAPLVFIPAVITNLVDAVCAFVKQMSLSTSRNLRYSFNLLGEVGVMGPRRALQDDRGMAAKVIFGILSAPLVIIPALITNIVDAFCSLVKNFGISFVNNLNATFNLLGERGVMGPRRQFQDERSMTVKVCFGILSAPFVFIPALISNLTDAICSVIKNCALSYARNISATFNLLGDNGVMGPRQVLADDRGMPAKVIFGILSSPLVAISALVTNVIDIVAAFFKNTALSFIRNLRASYNLLGDRGVMGPHQPLVDNRGMPAKVIFGIISSPLLIIPVLVSNIIDGMCSLLKHVALSFGRNLRAAFNLLGEHGVMGARRDLVDDRGMDAKVIFGIISAPLLFIPAFITNLVDVVCTFIKQTALSFARNLRACFNLLGARGVMGERGDLIDDRGMPAKVIFGIISAPLVFIPALITNLIDAGCSFIKHVALSFGRNLRAAFNMLGEHGVMGARRDLVDDRGLPAKIIFGIISAPLLFMPAFITNLVDVVCIFIKQTALSFARNLRACFNLLGERGVMGPRRDLIDDRGMPAKVIFGIIAAPLVLIPALITNLVDAACSVIKNVALSFARNLNATFNLLGDNGVMGPRRGLQDDRGLPAKIIFGIVSAPLVAVTATITNIVDGICAIMKNLGLSFYHNLRSTFNLLGAHGIMGARRPFADARGMPAKVIYGILTAPLVLIPALITNLLDGIAAYFKNARVTILKPIKISSMLAGGALLMAASLPVFLMIKTIKAAWNCTGRLIRDKIDGQPFVGISRVMERIANLATCGVFSAGKKIFFKKPTGYTHRFGFPGLCCINNCEYGHLTL